MRKDKTPDNPLNEKKVSFKLFDRIYKHYDLLNHVFSLGMDEGWRSRLSAQLGKKDHPKILDLASGTGDVALRLLKDNPDLPRIYACDKSRNMMVRGRQKAMKKKFASRLVFVQADAENLPFPDHTFDAITMAFGIRNMPDPPIVLSEIRRILKKGGKVTILEFSLPPTQPFRGFFLFYLRHLIPLIGRLVSGEPTAYRYLNQTIETFPYGEKFCQWLQQADYRHIAFTPLTLGLVTLYQGEK
ncbi:MAG: bifunctional demethylmenaquinone methyltransferase/2-methoxy-6-polyprenyl-1,4-benzoquinol methylase UbiE [Candidatus Omnitrophota bacterium]